MVEDSIEKQILIDQIERLLNQTLVGIYATILASCILAGALLGDVPNRRIGVWMTAVLLLNSVRIFVHSRLKKNQVTTANVVRRKRIILFFLFASGCLWGGTGIFLFPYASISQQVLISFIVGGMVAGSIGMFASISETYSIFSIPALLPLMVNLFLRYDTIHYSMGIMIVLFWLFMFVASKKLNAEVLQSLKLKHNNLALIIDLECEVRDRRDAEERLLRKNQEIETIVESRTAELIMVNNKLLKEIEDRAQAQTALKDSEEKYRELADSLPQIVFEIDAQGKLLFANQNALKLFGYSESDLAELHSVVDIMVAEDRKKTVENFQSILQGKKLEGTQYTAIRKDGTKFPIAIHSTVVTRDGKPTGLRGIAIDLTEEKIAEEEQNKLLAQLQRAQKMELLGTMAGGVAHDLNNILSGIVSYPDLLLAQLPQNSPLRGPIETIKKSGSRAAAMVQDLLTLTRRGVVFEEVLNLNQIVSEYLESPEHKKMLSFHEKVRVISSLDGNLLNVVGSSVHLTKTIMNLVSNAAEAMPAGGNIVITTSNCYLDQPLKGYDNIKEGDYSVLVVSDSGIGISSGDIDRIFEPFYTKKIMGRSGTGLGMAVVWGTVKDHKGYIDVVSELGKGTTFSLYFPVTREKIEVIEDPDPVGACLGHGESILVVDDIKEQRMIASEMLTALGYHVTTAASGEEAIEYMKKNSVDLLVLDMIMDPGLDGLNTYQKIVEIHPRQKAIIASGYSETDRVKAAQRLGAGAYLRKPYTLTHLGQTVRTELDTTGKSDRSGIL